MSRVPILRSVCETNRGKALELQTFALLSPIEGFLKSSPGPSSIGALVRRPYTKAKKAKMAVSVFLAALILATAATTAGMLDDFAAVEFCRRPLTAVDDAVGGGGGGAIPGCGNENEIGDEEDDLRRRRRRRRMRRSAFVPYKTGAELSEQVSGTLDKVLLFSGYDKQIRPGVSRTHTEVSKEVHRAIVLYGQFWMVKTVDPISGLHCAGRSNWILPGKWKYTQYGL